MFSLITILSCILFLGFVIYFIGLSFQKLFQKYLWVAKFPILCTSEAFILSPNLKASLTDTEFGFKIALSLDFSSIQCCCWEMNGACNPHTFVSNPSFYLWSALGFFSVMIWHSTMTIKVLGLLKLVLWHRVGPFNLMNYVFLQL